MACWVVPTVAAEFWGVSLDHVLGEIDSGSIPHKTESGWVFVDVARNDVPPATDPGGTDARPSTFTVVNAEPDEPGFQSDSPDAPFDAGTFISLCFAGELRELAGMAEEMEFAHEWAMSIDAAAEGERANEPTVEPDVSPADIADQDSEDLGGDGLGEAESNVLDWVSRDAARSIVGRSRRPPRRG